MVDAKGGYIYWAAIYPSRAEGITLMFLFCSASKENMKGAVGIAAKQLVGK
jgi:hypothetical protein